jgi:hypothetical protein
MLGKESFFLNAAITGCGEGGVISLWIMFFKQSVFVCENDALYI